MIVKKIFCPVLSCFINFIVNSFVISYWIYFVVIEREKKKKSILVKNKRLKKFITIKDLKRNYAVIMSARKTKICCSIFCKQYYFQNFLNLTGIISKILRND